MYQIDDKHRMTMEDRKTGELQILSNFSAEIIKETRFDDGEHSTTLLTIVGKQADRDLPAVEVSSDQFVQLNWVMRHWGVSAVINPGGNVKDHLRTAIQLHSKPKRKTVYTHLGWTKIGQDQVYLHAGGGITKDGNNPNITVGLPNELMRYKIVSGSTVAGLRATLDLFELSDPEFIGSLIGAIVAPLMGPTDFAVHISGRTGTFKSELAALAQQHYGSEMDSRHLPASWSSTPNALEALAYRTKNAMITIDDFIPAGASWQQKAYQKTADQIIRGQGNQAGRARLTDVSRLQETMYPRGCILSTGEDTPEGHSVRGRMMILETTPDKIDTTILTKAQNNRELFSQGLAGFIRALAKNLAGYSTQHRKNSVAHRDTVLGVGHSRTPSTYGQIMSANQMLIEFAIAQNAIESTKGISLLNRIGLALKNLAEQQEQYLSEADPCQAFIEAIRHILRAQLGHIRTVRGGIPLEATHMGWVEENALGDLPTYKAHGKCIGWCDSDANELYIDAVTAYNDIKRHGQGQISLGKQTMFKRLKDGGYLTRTDDHRQRNTIRMTCERHPRTVLALPLSTTIDAEDNENG